MSKLFFSPFYNLPGCLPDGDDRPAVFGTYSEAAESLADVLDSAAEGYDEGDPDGDAFAEAARECRASTEEDSFAWYGPDGYNYYVEEIVPRGTWTAHDSDLSDGEPSVLVVFSGSEVGVEPEEAADDVSTLCGSRVECPRDVGAYVIVESFRLREAAAELRDSGYLLVDEDGDPIDPEGVEDLGEEAEAALLSDPRDRYRARLDVGDRVRYSPDDAAEQEGRGTVRGFAVSPDNGRPVVDVDDDAGGDTTWRYLSEVESTTAGAVEVVRSALRDDDDDGHEALSSLSLAAREAGEALSHARTLLDDPGAGNLPAVLDRIDSAIGRLRRAGVLPE